MLLHAILHQNAVHPTETGADRLDQSAADGDLRKGVRRKTLEQFLCMPAETVRRHVATLKSSGLVLERTDGLVGSQTVVSRRENSNQSHLPRVLLTRMFAQLAKTYAHLGGR